MYIVIIIIKIICLRFDKITGTRTACRLKMRRAGTAYRHTKAIDQRSVFAYARACSSHCSNRVRPRRTAAELDPRRRLTCRRHGWRPEEIREHQPERKCDHAPPPVRCRFRVGAARRLCNVLIWRYYIILLLYFNRLLMVYDRYARTGGGFFLEFFFFFFDNVVFVSIAREDDQFSWSRAPSIGCGASHYVRIYYIIRILDGRDDQIQRTR